MASRVVTALCCIDGRSVRPLAEWMRKKYHAIEVDVITDPGLAALLATGHETTARRGAEVSVTKHGSERLVVAGHAPCASIDESEAAQKTAVLRAREVVESWGLGVPVDAAWVDERHNVMEIGRDRA